MRYSIYSRWIQLRPAILVGAVAALIIATISSSKADVGAGKDLSLTLS